MGYGLPSFSSKTPLAAILLNMLTESIDWQHDRTPYPFDLDGDQISGTYGLGEVMGKLQVDPASYSGYDGYPGPWGEFPVALPSGLFTDLLDLDVQVASGGNGAMTATVKDESISGFTVFVNDPGGTDITPFALWICVLGKLSSGKVPS